MPTTHRDQNYHRHQIPDDDTVIVSAEGVDLEARSDPAITVPDAGWLRLRSRDGFLPERVAEGGGVQAAECMAIKPYSGGGYFGAGCAFFQTSIIPANKMHTAPFVLPFRLQIDAAFYRLVTPQAGKYIRFGLYAGVPGESYPRDLVKEFGPEETAGAGVKLHTWETILQPGYYFWCFLTDATTATIKTGYALVMQHMLAVSPTSLVAKSRTFYSHPYVDGLPTVWRENDEILQPQGGNPYVAGVRVA